MQRCRLPLLVLLTLPTTGCLDALLAELLKSPCLTFSPDWPVSVPVDATCTMPYWNGSLNPNEEWAWPAAGDAPRNVMVTPVVIPIDDADGDGLPDQSMIVFTSFETDSDLTQNEESRGVGELTALDGHGNLLWSIPSVTFGANTYRFSATGGVAAGDLTGDGIAEICAAGFDATLICVDQNGQGLWASGTQNEIHSYPAMADMDADSVAEVTIGNLIFDASGNLIAEGKVASGYPGRGGFDDTFAGFGYGRHDISVPADLDGDGKMELVTGSAVYDLQGNALWSVPPKVWGTNSVMDGFPAIIETDGDPELEIAVHRAGSLYLYAHDGTLLASGATGVASKTKSQVHGGPPTVANFDLDDEPEVAVAGDLGITIWDVYGLSTPQLVATITYSSVSYWSDTSALAAFDFDGDGVDEIVYSHELDWHVWDVLTGTDLLLTANPGMAGAHRSGTMEEMPVIADIDGDGYTEILIASDASDSATYGSQWQTSDWSGIHAIGSRDKTWPQSLPVWNQHAFSQDNVDPFDAAIPPGLSPDGSVFRAAPATPFVGIGLPDLSVYDAEWCTANCDKNTKSIWYHVAVQNTGTASASAFEVRVYDGQATLIGSTSVTQGLAAGGVVDVALPVLKKTAWKYGHPTVEVDTTGTVAECDEDNNTFDLGKWPCSGDIKD